MIWGRFRPKWGVYYKFRRYCNETMGQSDGLSKENKGSVNKKGLPEPPTTCCMTGCPNCVWMDYAEAVTEYFKDGGKSAIKEIEKNISDPNMMAYLMHELKMRNKTN